MDTTPDGVATASDVPRPSLQDRIQTLTDAHIRLQSLRRVPALLLRPPSGSPLADFAPSFDAAIDREFGATFGATPGDDFRALKAFGEVLCSDKVEEALQAARASEEADQGEIGLVVGREGRKRKRPRSPVGSPQPYVPSPPRTWTLFAPPEEDPPPMRAESLVAFVRAFNRGHGDTACKLAIWTRTQVERDALRGARAGLTSPVVLRFVIADVLTAYISLTFASAEGALAVESVAAFGPRERKLPHAQSDHIAFQGLSEHMTRMIRTHPGVPVPMLMNVLVSYRGLFVDRCTRCERVLSAEGHIPPVARVWVPADRTDHGRWEARHGACVQG